MALSKCNTCPEVPKNTYGYGYDDDSFFKGADHYYDFDFEDPEEAGDILVIIIPSVFVVVFVIIAGSVIIFLKRREVSIYMFFCFVDELISYFLD